MKYTEDQKDRLNYTKNNIDFNERMLKIEIRKIEKLNGLILSRKQEIKKLKEKLTRIKGEL